MKITASRIIRERSCRSAFAVLSKWLPVTGDSSVTSTYQAGIGSRSDEISHPAPLKSVPTWKITPIIKVIFYLCSRVGLSWRPVNRESLRTLGFCTDNLDVHFKDACDRLSVVPVSGIDRGYWGKALGATVATEDGARFWLKVFGVTRIDNPNRATEIRSDELTGICKPSLVAQCDWIVDGSYLTARLMTLADPAVERGLWAGAAAVQLPDAWFDGLKKALLALGSHASTGTFLRQKTLENWLLERHGIRYEFPQDAWCLSHNDLNWSNVTAPALSILDWEWHGYAPVGYDIGRMIAFACRHDSLVIRLERLFAQDFAKFSGLVARAFAADQVMQGIRSGFFDPAMEPCLAGMIERLDARLRAERPHAQ